MVLLRISLGTHRNQESTRKRAWITYEELRIAALSPQHQFPNPSKLGPRIFLSTQSSQFQKLKHLITRHPKANKVRFEGASQFGQAH